MRRLWLHIGSHKTGTTTLQSSLRAASKKKELGRWNYIAASNAINMNNIVSVKGDGADMQWKIKPVTLRRQIPAQGDCIISGERLFWLEDEVEILRLANILKTYFDEIRVVAYLRRQDSVALSFRKTVIVAPVARRFFGIKVGALPDYLPHMDRYFDYYNKIVFWKRFFGKDNVIVRKYESDSLVEGNTVSDFSNIIGQDIPLAPKMLNVSWSRSQLLVGLWLQSKGYSVEACLDIIKNIGGTERLLPSRIDAMRFMERFRESNAALAENYGHEGLSGYFSNDFSDYPEKGNDNIDEMALDLKKIETELSNKFGAEATFASTEQLGPAQEV